MIDGGRISEQGSYDHLLSTVDGAFAAFLKQHLSAREDEETDEESQGESEGDTDEEERVAKGEQGSRSRQESEKSDDQG